MTAMPSDAAPQGLPGDPHTAALAYASLGWRIVPIGPGRKYPELPAWQTAATDDLATIRNWYDNLYRGHGVGILTGPDTGIWVLDVDTADSKTGAESLAQLVADHHQLPATPAVLTGSGGYHIYFAWDPHRPITNGHATRLGPGLDIRGAGGQVVAPPTTHPITGQPYRWVEGLDPWTVDLSPAPEWLYDILLVEQATAPAAAPTGSSTGSVPSPVQPADTDSDSIAEAINNAHNWADLLEQQGWTLHSTHGDDTWWTRPGKDPRHGHSAVLHGQGALVIFTTEVNPALAAAGRPTTDGSGFTLSKFGFIAGTQFGGDRSALARTARLEANRTRNQVDVAQVASVLPSAPQTLTTAALATTTVELTPVPAGAQGLIDLGAWYDDPEPARPADLLHRTDGTGLLYLDQLNLIFGDSGSGKTWLLLVALLQAMSDGAHVVWVHYEDPNPATIVGRLKALGATRQQVVDQFHYWDPQGEPLDPRAVLEACQTVDAAHVAIDSMGEALNAAGLNEDADTDVGPWLTVGPRMLVNHGIGVTIVDHVAKDTKNPLHPSGSKRKRAAITGAGLRVEALMPPTRTTDGRLRVTMAKDRHGNHPQGQTVAEVPMRHDIVTGLLTVELVATTAEQAAVDGHEKRVREVVRIVATDPGINRNAIARVMSSASAVRKKQAVDDAIDQGLIRVEMGPRNAQELHPSG